MPRKLGRHPHPAATVAPLQTHRSALALPHSNLSRPCLPCHCLVPCSQERLREAAEAELRAKQLETEVQVGPWVPVPAGEVLQLLCDESAIAVLRLPVCAFPCKHGASAQPCTPKTHPHLDPHPPPPRS